MRTMPRPNGLESCKNNTLEFYESTRQQKETVFHPQHIKDYKIIRYLSEKGTAVNSVVLPEIFDSINQMKDCGETIQAIGYNGLKPTILILKKP